MPPPKKDPKKISGSAQRQAREETTAKPPPPSAPYKVVCRDCNAQPGQWCEAVKNLPPGTLLRDPHHIRITDARDAGH